MGRNQCFAAIAAAILVLSGCGGTKQSQVDPALTKQLADIRERLDGLSAKLTEQVSQEGNPSPDPDAAVEFHTASEAKDFIKKLGKNPAAQKLAEAFATVDAWPARPEQEKELQQYKLELASQLRKQVKEEVVALQKAALDAPTGADGVKKHSEAGAVLALYPMSEDKAITEDAKNLAAQQGELAVRLEVIRRQRYNRWATEKIEAAIKGYNDTKSAVPYKTDRPKLVASLVDSLGPVDPALLEPAVLELYNYCIDNTKGALYEAEKIDLAKKLTEPSIVRKTLGDF
jgi:hypothetical protein